MPKKQPKAVRIVCAECMRATNHTLVRSYKTAWDDEGARVCGGAENELLRCDGCDAPTLRVTSWFSEDEGPSEICYPPRPGKPLREPKQFARLQYGSVLESAYRQTVAALNGQLLTLAGAGARLVIEGVCREQKVEDGPVPTEKEPKRRRDNLEGKINGLVEKGHISPKQAETLHEIRFLGNDAAHELYQPSVYTVETAIDIIDHLLAQVYEQPFKGERLAARKRP